MEGSEIVTIRGLVRVYFNDGTFKTFSINNTTTAEKLCSMFAAKMRLSGRHFTLYECLNGHSSPIPDNEKPLMIQRRYLAKGLNFGESRLNGFLCMFKSESLKTLKQMIIMKQASKEVSKETPSSPKQRLTPSFFKSPNGNVTVANSDMQIANQKEFPGSVSAPERIQSIWKPPKKYGQNSEIEPQYKNPSFEEKEQKGEEQLMAELEDLKASLSRNRAQTAAVIPTWKNRPVSQKSPGETPTSSPRSSPRDSPTSSIGAASRPFSSWTVVDVCKWLSENGLREYVKVFSDHAIDGLSLLLLDDNDFREMGVKIGHRKKILNLIEKWKPQKYGSRSSTVGITEGVEWENEEESAPSSNDNKDLDGLIVRLSGLTALQTIAEGEVVDVDSYLALISKQLEKDFQIK